MKTVNVNLGKRSYGIYIGKGVIGKLSSFIKLDVQDTPIFVVTNKKIKRLHGKMLLKVLKTISKKVLFYEVPDSERAKSFPVYIKTVRSLARFSRKKKPLVFAFGGGVIGDLAGFVASAYRRGVPYIQLPTTLLAQVDSAIGGKVAIDIKEAKNIVGNFYQPKAVLCDLQFLKTLPEKELRNGLSEVVKYGIIKDEAFFSFLEKNIKKILALNEKSLEYIVSTSCAIKARTVEKDEHDTSDVRAILNFGHTLGHAIEAASGYSKSIKHGQAVAKGMALAGLIAVNLKILKASDYKRMCSLIRKVSPSVAIKPKSLEKVLEALSYDKKFIRGVNRFILPEKIGSVKIVNKIPMSLIKKVLKD